MGSLLQGRKGMEKRNLQERCEGQIGNEETDSHTITDVYCDVGIPVLCEMDQGR